MKRPPTPRFARRLAANRKLSGFSLIELLIVIALIALLAALSVVGIQLAMKRSKMSETKSRQQMIQSLLDAYKSDHGEYPEEVAWNRMGDFLDGSWPIGGGATLYQALCGDGTTEIRGFQAREGQNSGGSTGEFGSSGTEVYFKDLTGKKTSYVAKSGESYAMIDSFGHPFVYRRYDKNQDMEFNNEGTYDLWSYGHLTSATDSEEDKNSWIKNWGD